MLFDMLSYFLKDYIAIKKKSKNRVNGQTSFET